jgi:hypothetical protein
MRGNELGVIVMLGGILLFMAIITLLDWLGRRKERRTRGSN